MINSIFFIYLFIQLIYCENLFYLKYLQLTDDIKSLITQVSLIYIF